MRKPANPVLWLVIALPLLAVAASLASLALAVTRGDSELPKDYHWEGGALDRDQQRLARAAQMQIGAMITCDPATRLVTIMLHGAAPGGLRLALTHPTDARADRRLALPGSAGAYHTACGALPMAHWWLEVSDDRGQWLLRGRTYGALQEPVLLGATPPGTPAPP